MARYQVIVAGVGGVGSAALYHLARRGVAVLGLDRFPVGHDRGSSHGQTRIIRQAYYEHPDYVPLLLRAYELWRELEQRCGAQLLFRTGLLQVGPSEGKVLTGVRASAQRHHLQVEPLSADEIRKRWPGFRVPEGMSGLYEPQAGYLRVEACVAAHVEEARRCGAVIFTDQAVMDWQAANGGVLVKTERGQYVADKLILAPGPWATQLLKWKRLRLAVLRKPQYWFRPFDRSYDADAGCPAYLFELPEGLFYGFPRIDSRGVKAAVHTGGSVVSDPLNVDRSVDLKDRQQVEQFLSRCLPLVLPEMTDHSVCLYTMSTDQHFVVDQHPHCEAVYFAAGLSGHGFKFTCVLGQALAELATLGATSLPVDFLRRKRFGL